MCKKIVSVSSGLVDLPVRLVDFIHHLPIRQVIFMDLADEVRLQRNAFWVAHNSSNMPKGQAEKSIFFVPLLCLGDGAKRGRGGGGR